MYNRMIDTRMIDTGVFIFLTAQFCDLEYKSYKATAIAAGLSGRFKAGCNCDRYTASFIVMLLRITNTLGLASHSCCILFF